MNKIDAMWDDIGGSAAYDESIRSQIKTSAAILKINENAIFPVSAKQALLAKVKSDPVLFERSRLSSLEKYLATNILKQKRNILMGTVVRDMGFLLNESSHVTNKALAHAVEQLEEFKKTDFQNKDMTGKLMAETRDKQNVYMANIENFQASRRVFISQAKMLIDSFDSEKVDGIIEKARREIASNMTTYGMKQNIRKLFDDLRELLQNAIEITAETSRLVRAIHKKFKDEYGFEEIDPKLFSIKTYQVELEMIFEEGEIFRSSTKTAMTEQSIVIHNLYSTLISRARDVLRQAHDDATAWGNTALTPLMQQIKDHKKQIENRLQMLRKINESADSVAESIAKLQAEVEPLKRQRDELNMMIRAMRLDAYSPDSNN
jgi:uncharacterized coiled-coil DUF342 family protein